MATIDENIAQGEPKFKGLGKEYRNVVPRAVYDLIHLGREGKRGITRLFISQGSVVDFEGDAIVNAANEGCLGGGGVDGAIAERGGKELAKAREDLPRTGRVRCPTGSAVLTIGGDLPAKYCIHAVGPMYDYFQGGRELYGDRLLVNAYQTSLDIANKENMKAIGFSLLSSGIFRGGRSLRSVLTLGLQAIIDYVEGTDPKQARPFEVRVPYENANKTAYVDKPETSVVKPEPAATNDSIRSDLSFLTEDEIYTNPNSTPLLSAITLEEIHLVAFTKNELAILLDVAKVIFKNRENTEDGLPPVLSNRS